MITLAARICQHVQAQGVPIKDVGIGDDGNRATWRVVPDDLQAAAQPHLDSFVFPTAAQLLDEEADQDLNVRAFRALARECWELVPPYAGKPTVQAFFERIKARYKALA